MDEIPERQLLIRGGAFATFSTIEKALEGRKSFCGPYVVQVWHKGLKHYVLYCLENDDFKTAQISPVSTEWIVLVWFIKYVVTITISKGVYVQVIRSTAKRYFRERQHGPA